MSMRTDELLKCYLSEDTRYADLINGVNFTAMGVENQSRVDYLMPLWTLVYAVNEYQRQTKRLAREHGKNKDVSGEEYFSGFCRTDRLLPNITLVLFYGEMVRQQRYLRNAGI